MTSSHPHVTVFFQDACLSHRFIRSRDTSTIFERPQRLRAVKTGVATAIARLEQCRTEENSNDSAQGTPDQDKIVTALKRLHLSDGHRKAVNVIMSSASVDILRHPAVKYVHGDVDGNVYLENLVSLVRESEEKVARGESEIPEGLSQGDLYLCKESLNAIQGAIGTVCEAVDTVLRSTGKSPIETPTGHQTLRARAGSSTAFVAVRPPGHHCGEDTPSGFCFVNNVAIGAAHAHLQHDISRVVILDIDLHHGNGTQSIAWQINEETYRQQLESNTSDTPGKRGLMIYYGSVHDVLSYPCEDGNTALLQAASVCLHGPHGQHIENVHLSSYESDQDFWDRLYRGPYTRLLQRAEAFLKKYEQSDEACMFISAGFDASEHEHTSMSRHGRKVPTGFYHRFARDARKIADQYAKGRVVSVLEGGYSNRALCSGAMAHVLGLAEVSQEVDESWWSLENLIKIEKATKKSRNGRPSGITSVIPEKWLERTLSVLSTLILNPSPPPTPKQIPPSTMTLRDRNKRPNTDSPNQCETPPPKSQSTISDKDRKTDDAGKPVKDVKSEDIMNEAPLQVNAQDKLEMKKLPRVILKVNPPTLTTQGKDQV